MLFPRLYKYTTSGKPQQWEIIVEGDSFRTIEGLVGGALTESKPTVCKPKNAGRSNETTAEQQAMSEAASRWQKKVDKGYNEVLTAESKFFEPMLAHKLDDYQHLLFTVPTYIQPKLDGLRCISDKGTLASRNGKPYLSCPHLHQSVALLDGELFARPPEEPGIEIELSRGLKALVSEEDYEELAMRSWSANTAGYAVSKSAHGEVEYMHRVIVGAPHGESVDHINGVKWDNRRTNLRLATMSQNLANTKARSNSQSGLKGVYFFKRDGTWQAQITVNYKKIHLGYFETPQQAADAYDEAAKQYFGSFARLNKQDVDFNEIVSLAKKTKPTLADLKLSAERIKLWVYDLPGCPGPFSQRYVALKSLFDSGSLSDTHVLVPTHRVSTHAEVEQWHEYFLAQGFEGSIIRLDLGGYENKRSKQLLKKKDFQDSEYKIIGAIEGEGNRTGTIGAFVMEMPDGKQFNSNVKGDFVYLAEVWNQREKFINTMATVTYFNLTPDGVPRFPYITKLNRASYE